MIQDDGNTFLPAYDATGNIHALMTVSAATIDSVSYSSGDIVAAYEYDAFGQTLRESGKYAASNPFRFSTKYTDIETGLVYYGHRYYSPSLGRFINRDPIEEQGGINLYSFVGNNAVNAWDYLGMDKFVAPDEYGNWVEMDGDPFETDMARTIGIANQQNGVSPVGSSFSESNAWHDRYNNFVNNVLPAFNAQSQEARDAEMNGLYPEKQGIVNMGEAYVVGDAPSSTEAPNSGVTSLRNENDQFAQDNDLVGRTDITLAEMDMVGRFGMKQATGAETEYHRRGPGNLANPDISRVFE